jgi:hypothetical protein
MSATLPTTPTEPHSEDIASSLGEVLSRLLQALRDSEQAAFRLAATQPWVVDAVERAKALEVDAYHYGFSQELARLESGLLDHVFPNQPQVQFIFSHLRFVELQFLAFIKKHEGDACSVDKARFLVDALLRHYLQGRRLSIDRNQQYTYHLPTKVFVEHNEMLDFFVAVQGLYYGRVHAYLACCAAIERRLESAEGAARA